MEVATRLSYPRLAMQRWRPAHKAMDAFDSLVNMIAAPAVVASLFVQMDAITPGHGCLRRDAILYQHEMGVKRRGVLNTDLLDFRRVNPRRPATVGLTAVPLLK